MESKAKKLALLFEENKPADLDLNADQALVFNQPRFEVLKNAGLRIHYPNPLATTVSKWRVIDLDNRQAVELAHWLKANYLTQDLKRVK